MDITLTLNATIEHAEDTGHMTEDEIVDALIVAVTNANPKIILGDPGTTDGQAQYSVTIWDVDEG